MDLSWFSQTRAGLSFPGETDLIMSYLCDRQMIVCVSQESIDDEREAWITQKGKNNVPTVKDLLSAHEYPWQVGGHLITCPNVTGYDNDNHDDHDDDITIVCVKDATGRTQHMTVRSEEKQEGAVRVDCVITSGHVEFPLNQYVCMFTMTQDAKALVT